MDSRWSLLIADYTLTNYDTSEWDKDSLTRQIRIDSCTNEINQNQQRMKLLVQPKDKNLLGINLLTCTVCYIA
uniref:Neur_chan_LBD domain-containing protein n=1 Tax=Heterorhabditis bacteriophora TaxID=37862 RepID=A0A1I7WNI3_HETBA